VKQTNSLDLSQKASGLTHHNTYKLFGKSTTYTRKARVAVDWYKRSNKMASLK